MRHFIGNEVNSKSVISNVVNKTFPNVTIIYGEYGTGKTEFAIEIARLLTCNNPSYKGYCGTCPNCKKSQKITESTFLANISLTNMTLVDVEKVKQLVHDNVNKVSMGKTVYIYDEFHAVPTNLQEMWLAETSKLVDTHLILTTASLHKVDKGIRSRALPIQMMPLNLQDIYPLLELYGAESLDKSIVPILYETYLGQPRPIINQALYCINSNLTVEEQIQFIRKSRKIDVERILMLITNKSEFFRIIRDTTIGYSPEDFSSALRDFLWDSISTPDADYARTRLATIYSKQHLVLLLADLDNKPDVSLIKLYSQMKFSVPSQDSAVVRQNIDRSAAEKQKERTTLEKW